MADESLRITAENESLRIAKETLTGASAFVKQLQEACKSCDDLVKANLNNDKMLPLYKEERDKAHEFLERARADLEKAQERLDKLLIPQASNELLEEVKRIMIDTTSEVKEVKRTMMETTTEFREVKRTMKETTTEFKNFKETVTEKFANLELEESSGQLTDSAAGRFELERLAKDELNINVTGDGDPFWSQVHQDNANAIENESVFIAYITPFFDDIVQSCDMVFVNSEEYGWLPQSIKKKYKLRQDGNSEEVGGLPPSSGKKYNSRPDGFSTHRGMFTLVKEDNGRLFGKAVKELFDCIILFEGKLTIHDGGFWQVKRYLNNLDREGSASAILFDRTSFWMITTHSVDVSKVEKMDWVAPGSKTIFQNFIIANKSPWISRLQEACNQFNVHIVDNEPFLGRGATGRVFKVVRDEEEFALKIAEKSSTDHVLKEMEALRNAENSGLTIKPIEGCVEYSNGVAMLLSPVGSPFGYPTKKKDIVKLFEFLHQLHIKNLFHGDPRIPNVICHNGRLIWIDLVEVFDLSQHDLFYLRCKDIATLTRSILRKPHSAELGNELEGLMIEYVEDASVYNLIALADEVYQQIPKK